MEQDKLNIAVEKILSVWKDLEISFEDSGESDVNSFISRISGYEKSNNKTRLGWIKSVLQEYIGFASDEELEDITSAVRKMDLVETYIANNGLDFKELGSLEDLADMGNTVDNALEGKDYDELYNFISNITTVLNPYGIGYSMKSLPLGEYLTRFGSIDEAYGTEAYFGFRYSINTEEDNGIILLDINNPYNLLNKVNGTSREIVEYWLDSNKCGKSISRILLLEAWNYKRIVGSRGGKGTKVKINGCDKEFDYKEKSIRKYKYGYTLFDKSVVVYLV